MMDENFDLQSWLEDVGSVMKKTDLSKVSAESTGFEDLPEGYYLAEVIDVKPDRCKSGKNEGKPTLKMRLKVVGDGFKLAGDPDELEDEGKDLFEPVTGVNGRFVFKTFTIGEESLMKRFASDMMKFEEPNNPGKMLLPEEAWADPKIMFDSVSLLVDLASRIWLHNKVTKKEDGTNGAWVDFLDFSRAAKLGLPVD